MKIVDKCTDEVAGSSPVAPAKSNLVLPMLQINLPQVTDLFQLPFNTSSLGTVDPDLFWILFYIIILVFIIISFILHYHWKNYSITPHEVKKVYVLYFSVSFLLIASMFIFLRLYL
jgi:hypothetical protein